MTATVTSDFRHEFDQERTRWIRKRVLWYFGVLVVLGAALTAVGFGGMRAMYEQQPIPDVVVAMDWLLRIGYLLIHLAAALVVLRKPLSRETMLSLVQWVIIISAGATTLFAAMAIRIFPPQSITQTGENGGNPELLMGLAIGLTGLWSIFISHFFAALFIPWSPREAMRPLLPLIVLFVLVTALLTPGPGAVRAGLIVASPLVGAPGVAIAWWRHSRFRQKFHYRALRGVYGDMKRELMDARRIHEALFPAPITEGPVRLDYRYEPAKHIGGDFLYVHRFPGLPGESADREPLSVLLLDVTGHGIPAALTVNRLHGELDRLFGEEPDISPGEVLSALNHYVHLTMANHSVFATALCLRIDVREGVVAWASGGHPPAFLRTVDGRLDRLGATSFVLGACGQEEFDANEQTIRLGEGDTIVAYTDGAIESCDERGAMLRLEGLQAMLLSISPRAVADKGWAAALHQMVESWRCGPSRDDTLFVEIYRPAPSA